VPGSRGDAALRLRADLARGASGGEHTPTGGCGVSTATAAATPGKLTAAEAITAHHEYRAAGYQTIPIRLSRFRDNGRWKKKPHFPGGTWKKAAEADVEEAVRNGYTDVALLCDNLVVLDFDPRDGETPDDVLERARAAARHYGLRAAMVEQTGDGAHLFCRLPDSPPAGGWKGHKPGAPCLADEVLTKNTITATSRGALVFVAPSFHPVVKRRYQRLTALVPVAELPACPVELLDTGAPAPKPGTRTPAAAPTAAPSPNGDFRTLDVVALFKAANLYKAELADKKHSVTCPWEAEHTSGSDGTDTVVWEAGAKGVTPGFKCLHAHCAQRTMRDVRERLGAALVDAHCSAEWQPTRGKSGRPPDGGDGEGKGPSQAQILVTIADAAELWHTPDGTAYATMPTGKHRDHVAVRSTPFRRWLAHRFYREQGKAPGSQAVADALAVLEGKAMFDGAPHDVHIRVAEGRGAVYLDLCDDDHNIIRVTPAGWQIAQDPPVRFRRSPGMAPLPLPRPRGTLRQLRRYLNVDGGASFRLIVAWLVAALRPQGPYPILVLQGEQGSTKSTLARLLRMLVDPSTAPLRTAPREDRDLMIAAHNTWVLAFDNLSGIPDRLADGICRLATGGGYATRTLYTDAEETIFDAARPIILNGIEDLTTRDDLRDRAVIPGLPVIPDHKRRDEASFWRDFERARPYIFGALLDALSAALRELPTTTLADLPRMADFALFATAAEHGMRWRAGAFLSAYRGNRRASVELAVEHDAVAAEVREIAEARDWSGTAGELLAYLDARVPEERRKLKEWPRTPRALAGRLTRMAPALRALGIEVEHTRAPDATRRRLLHIGKRKSAHDRPDRPHRPAEPKSGAPSTSSPGRCADGAVDGSDLRPSNRPQDRPAERPHAATLLDDVDDVDGSQRSRSDAAVEVVEL
jgi:hypothetical protein